MGRLTSLPSAVITDDSALGGAVIEKSLRFNTVDGAFLERTPSIAGNRKKWTFSAWIKRTTLGFEQRIFGGDANASHIYFAANEYIIWDLANENSGSPSANLATQQLFRDTSWFHLVCALDTDESTANNRMRMYINGSEVTDFRSRTNPSSGYATNAINATSVHTIGRRTSAQGSDGMRFDGFMAEVNFIDGLQLDPSHFGYTEFQTGIWRPKGYFGSYNTNGFRLDFSDNSAATATTLGKDRSGQGNDFTPYNFSVSAGEGNDSFDITPTKQSFASYEINDSITDAGSGKSYRQGGYTLYNTGAIHAAGRSSFPVNSGKWYAEFKLNTYSSRHGSTPYVGAARVEWLYQDFQTWIGNIGTAMNASGTTYRNGGSFSGGGVSYGAGDIISVAIDLDNGKQIWWAKNGTYINSGNPATNTGGHNISPLSQTGYYVFGTSGWASTSEWEANFGQRPFSYSVPAGFKTLQVDNLPDRTQKILRPQKHFGVATWSGNGTTSNRKISGLEFKPDLVWTKSRSDTYHHVWMDSVRGPNNRLNSDQNFTENNTNGGYLNSFDDGGFTWQYGGGSSLGMEWWNVNSRNYIAWCWKAGGAAVSNNDGSITSQVSANQEAGFSIISYTGNGTGGASVGHGLGKKPSMVIVKSRSATGNWDFHALGSVRMSLNLTEADQNNNQIQFSNTTFTIPDTNGNRNGNGVTYIAYCWAEIPGYSKFGIYKGNGSADGKFQFTGFRPAVIIYKRMSSADNWGIHDSTRDPKNPVYRFLYPDLTNAEWSSGSQDYCDFFANGFKWRSDASMLNGNDNNYFYMAFAEQPQFTPYDTQPNAR